MSRYHLADPLASIRLGGAAPEETDEKGVAARMLAGEFQVMKSINPQRDDEK